MSRIIERPRCPVCESKDILPLRTLDHRELSQCSKCLLVFASRFDEEELERAYQADFFPSPHAPRIQAWIDKNKSTWEDLYGELLRHREHITSLLDVGAGTGGFLLTVSAASPDTELFAIESSADARQNLSSRLPALAFPVDSAEDIGKVGRQFDCVTLLQCLEHVHSPTALLRGIYDCLQGGGILLITVPNRYSYKVLIHGMKETYCYSSTTHLQFFSDQTMRTALYIVGFQKVKRIARYGTSEYSGSKAILQWLFRKAGISTELRYIAVKDDG